MWMIEFGSDCKNINMQAKSYESPHWELRAIVDIMNQILEAPEQVPAEPYKQGELGELYTNLYKLVQALKESNRKEQEEKIFLRDIMSDISHQLKTPLASLTVFLDLLYDGQIRSAVWNGWCCPC